MTRKLVPGEKPLFWIGSSLKGITRFPSEVQRSVGFALSAAQYGGKHPSAKPWKGEGPNAVYVLHAFQKKSPHGIAPRQSDVALVKERLKLAQRDYEERYD
jgi:phage-related protein